MVVYDKPIFIQYKDHDNKQWMTFQQLHARINTTGSNEYTTSGSTRSSQSLTFTVRFNAGLKQIIHNLQDYRIAWDGHFYRIQSYDDYNLEHKNVKLVAESHEGANRDD